MNCKVCSKLMDDYAAGDLSGDMKVMIDDHLSQCDSCRSLLDQIARFPKFLTDSIRKTTGMLKLRPEVEDSIVEAMLSEGQAIDYPAVTGMRFDLLDLLRTHPIKEQIQRIVNGLRMPKDSGEYKWARYALMRIFGPSSISIVSTAIIVLLATIFTVSEIARPSAPAFEATILEPTKTDLDKLKVEEEKPPEETPTEENPDRPDLPAGPLSEITTPGPKQDYSSGDNPDDPKPGVGGDLDVPMVPLAAVMTKSPVIMKGLYGNRTKGGREGAIKAYGGGGGAGMMGEGAVLRALRWLKKFQEKDGSWRAESGGQAPQIPGEHYGYNDVAAAMTALGLLTFLGHGETPGSAEFGATVEKAIKWMLERQQPNGFFPPGGGGDLGYTHPICTYAICEAYGMTRLPSVKETAEKAVDYIIKNQLPNGGWNYQCGPGPRTDVSVTAWCAQALKAAKIAGIWNSQLDEAIEKARECFAKTLFNAGTGIFMYTNGGDSIPGVKGGLTCAGVLSMQLLGGANAPEARRGLDWLVKNASCDWNNPWGQSPFYYWYYTTQARFHAGGETWKQWNRQFSPTLVKNQTVLKGEGIDGKDIGYWKPVAGCEYCQNYVYNTTLCALQLEVYYRYLPTYQKPEEEPQKAAEAARNDDIKIEVLKPK